MNQTSYKITPNKIDLNNEYRIKIENYKDFETSLFKNIYEKARTCVRDIVYMNKEESSMGDSYNNVIVFDGERGKGKSSAMMSFQGALLDRSNTYFCKEITSVNFLSLDVIDPSYFEGNESLFEIILAKLFAQFKQELENNKNKLSDNHKRELVSAFQKVFEDLKCIKKRDDVYLKDPLDALIKLSSSTNLKASFCKLIDSYLQVFGDKEKKNFLLFTIDDFDLNIDGMYAMMEDIRQFLIIKKVIILIACKYSQVKETTYLELYHKFYKKVSNASKMEAVISDSEVISKGDKYLEKLLPNNRIIELLDLNNFNYYFNPNKRFENLTYIVPKGNEISLIDLTSKLTMENLEDYDTIKNIEDKFGIYIGENFQRTLFKYFYKKDSYRNLFICNRQNFVVGLAPKTFRELYSLLANTDEKSLTDYLKNQILLKLNQVLKSQNIAKEIEQLYLLLNESLDFIEKNDFILFNNFFIARVKANPELLTFVALENQKDFSFNINPLYTSNSSVYAILNNILNNNSKFDIQLFQLIDQFILFYYLKSKDFNISAIKDFKFFTPTFEAFLQKSDIRTVQKAIEGNNRRDIVFVTSDTKDSFIELYEQQSEYAKYLFLNLTRPMQTSSKNSYYTLSLSEYSDLKCKPNFSFEFFKIFQPSNLVNYSIEIDGRGRSWFAYNEKGELQNKYARLFYNPFFFDLFRIKFVDRIKLLLKDGESSDYWYFINKCLGDVLSLTLNDINQIYPYLELNYTDLIDQNPLLYIYYNFIIQNEENVEGFGNLINKIDSFRLAQSQEITFIYKEENLIVKSKSLSKRIKSWLKNDKPTFTLVKNAVNGVSDILPMISKDKKLVTSIAQQLAEILGENLPKKHLKDKEVNLFKTLCMDLLAILNG